MTRYEAIEASLRNMVDLFDGYQGMQLRDAKAAIALPAQAEVEDDGWLTIESAPKDGTPILIAGDGKVDRAIWGYAQPWIDGWWVDGHRSDACGPDFTPTHWRPLPKPPKDSP